MQTSRMHKRINFRERKAPSSAATVREKTAQLIEALIMLPARLGVKTYAVLACSGPFLGD